MKHTFGKRPALRVLYGLLAGVLVVSACGSGSSPASEDTTSDTVSSDTSAPRERNAMVGGFGTDGSGFIDIPLAGLTSRYRSGLTLHRNSDGSSNIAFHEGGTIEGESINTLVQARLLGNGTFDTTFGEAGFVKFELSDYSVNKILFDSQGNLLLWMQTYAEVTNSGASPQDNDWKEVNEIRAFTFGGSTPNANYGVSGVIALQALAPEGISEIVVGRRGTAADAIMLMRLANETQQIVSITPRGQIDTSVANGGVNAMPDEQHDNWDARLVDTSLLSRSDNMYEVAVAGPYRAPDLADCPKYDSCRGPAMGLDYSLLTARSTPIQGTTNEVDDLLEMGEGEILDMFLASDGVSYNNNTVSAKSAKMNERQQLPELIVTTRNYESSSTVRGVFNTETSQWTAVTHFSFFDESVDGSDIYYGQPVVAPTGPALIAFYDDYEKDTGGLIACNSTLGICDVADVSRIVYAQNIFSRPKLSDVRVDPEGQIHALVTGLSIAKTKTDALIDLASDGSPASVQTEQMPASLRTEAAVNGNTWTPDGDPKLGANNTIYISGGMMAEISGTQRFVPAIGIITKTQTPKRSVSQERFIGPQATGVGINWNSNLKFDGAGNDYVPAWKNNVYGLVRLLPGTKALDTSYGVGGFAQVDVAPANEAVCTWTDYEVADSGQVMIMHSVGKRLNDEDCDWDGRQISDVVALQANGALDPSMGTRGAFASLDISPGDGVVFSHTTKEIYVVNSSWIPDEAEGEIHQVSIRRYSVPGVLDTTFGTAGVLTHKGSVPLNSVSPVEADKEGRLIFAATTNSFEVINVRIARLNRDGTLDAAVDVPQPAPSTPSEQRDMREEQQQQVAAIPVPQPVQQPASVLISATKAIGDGNIEVSWISNAVTTNATYTATASPGGKTCTSATTSCVVKGLDAWQKYTFTVSLAGEAVQSSASVETQPVRMVKVGTLVAVKKLLTPGSKGATKYAVSGGCKLSKSTTLIALKKAGTCLLSVKTGKVGKTAATTRSVRIQVETTLPK